MLEGGIRDAALLRRLRMQSKRRMLTMPTSKPPNAMPTIAPIGSDEPLLSSPEVDEPGVVDPVLDDEGPEALPLEAKKVSKEADLLVVGRALDSLSDEDDVDELSEAADDGVLDDEGSCARLLDWEVGGCGDGDGKGCLGLLIGSGNPREMLSIPRQKPFASLSSHVEVKMHSRASVQSSE